jgi:hypothetical protein
MALGGDVAWLTPPVQMHALAFLPSRPFTQRQPQATHAPRAAHRGRVQPRRRAALALAVPRPPRAHGRRERAGVGAERAGAVERGLGHVARPRRPRRRRARRDEARRRRGAAEAEARHAVQAQHAGALLGRAAGVVRGHLQQVLEGRLHLKVPASAGRAGGSVVTNGALSVAFWHGRALLGWRPVLRLAGPAAAATRCHAPPARPPPPRAAPAPVVDLRQPRAPLEVAHKQVLDRTVGAAGQQHGDGCGVVVGQSAAGAGGWGWNRGHPLAAAADRLPTPAAGS